MNEQSDAQVLTVEKAQRMAEFFGILGDPNRWRILSVLAIKEMRVRDLAAAVEMSESEKQALRNLGYLLEDD